MKYLNLALLILFPVAWFAPLLRAALLPIFGMDEISVITGLQSLWGSDPAFALLVTFLAIFAPFANTLGLTLIHLVSIPVTNTSVNPARSTGVALFADTAALSQLWLFWVAPILGAVIGAVIW